MVIGCMLSEAFYLLNICLAAFLVFSLLLLIKIHGLIVSRSSIGRNIYCVRTCFGLGILKHENLALEAHTKYKYINFQITDTTNRTDKMGSI